MFLKSAISRPLVSGLKHMAVLIALSSLFGALPVVAQPPAPPNTLETLNKEAQASDPAGIHEYSQHLIRILEITHKDSAFVGSLTDRLARAELMARQGKRKLISEADIAHAFNALMRETGAPNTLTASVGAVHSNRVGFEGTLPAVISQRANGSLCNPGEAVWVVSMLIANVGRPAAPPSEPEHEPRFVAGGAPPVQRHLELFYANHSQSDVAEAFEHLFNHLHI
jgi:hypothetical protein